MPTSPAQLRLLALLRDSLWGTNMAAAMPPASHAEWLDVYRCARRHTVTAVAFDAVTGLPAHMLPPHDIIVLWAAQSEAIRLRSHAMDAAVSHAVQYLRDLGTDPLLIKGQTMARLYPSPMSRQCGDIDLCIPSRNQFGNVCESLSRLKTPLKHHSDKSVSFHLDNTEVELHPSLLDIHTPSSRRRISSLLTALPHTTVEIGGCHITTPHPAVTLLIISTHILKHAMGHGIGLRQICDMAMACRAISGTLPSGSFETLVFAARLDKWISRLMSLLVLHLGMPRDLMPYPVEISERRARPLLHIVMSSGNFGRRPNTDSTWQRRTATAAAFMRRSRFSATTAPLEALWSIWSLTKGML